MKKIFLLLVFLMGFAVMANADTFSYVNTGLGVGDVNVTFAPQDLSANNPYFAGQILVSRDGSAPFPVYCLSVAYAFGNERPTPQGDTQDVNVKSLKDMTSGLNPDVITGSGAKVAWLLNTYAPGVDSAVEGAALQLAIWEVLYDPAGSYGLSSGTFRATTGVSGVTDLAKVYWDSIGNNVSDAYWFDTRNYSDSNGKLWGQDLGAPIPEPTSLLLLGAGLGGLCLGCFRRRKQ